MSLLIVLALATNAASNVPDPDECIVLPCDEMVNPRIIGVPDENISPYANLDITVMGGPNLPLVNNAVEIWINPSCTNLWYCDGMTLTGTTDSNGNVVLNMMLGGCSEEIASVIIMAEGVPIRAYDFISSPDNDGGLGQGDVNLADFITFGATWGSECTDLDGDGNASIGDFIVFGQTFTKSCLSD